jgi:lysophospholipase L1-like esterase
MNNIRPIILEIPDYDINKAYEKQKISRKLLRQISMLVNNTPINCKEMFRKALNEMIREKGYTNNISIIRYQTWNSNGVKDLKVLYTSDGMHLNELGYSVLDSVIANEILRINN